MSVYSKGFLFISTILHAHMRKNLPRHARALYGFSKINKLKRSRTYHDVRKGRQIIDEQLNSVLVLHNQITFNLFYFNQMIYLNINLKNVCGTMCRGIGNIPQSSFVSHTTKFRNIVDIAIINLLFN